MKKNIIILLAVVFTSSFLVFNNGKASSDSPCSSSNIATVFNESLKLHRDVFFSSSHTDNNQESIILKHIDELQTLYVDINNDLVQQKKNYDEYQSKLFENAFLSAVEKKNMYIINKSTSYNNSFIDLYFQKIVKNKTPEKRFIIPTLVLGIEASLNYAVFSCNYFNNKKFQTEVLKTDNSTLGILDKFRKIPKKAKKDVYKSLETLKSALASYDTFIIAYPQHFAYEELKDAIRKWNTVLSNGESLSSSCVYPNHFNQTCKK